MQTAKIVQAVILMLIVAMAASCAQGKEYSARIFGPRKPALKDSLAVAVRFLELEKDSIQEPLPDWVKNETAPVKDTAAVTRPIFTPPETKPAAPAGEPMVKNGKPGEVRTKKIRSQ